MLWESAGAFFPDDNSLVSARKSHRSGVRGLVVRCLLFNPAGLCSNRCVLANFFPSIPKQKVLTFFGTRRLPPFSKGIFFILNLGFLRPSTLYPICFFLKTGVFCMRLLKFFIEAPLNVHKKRNVLRALRTPQGFRHYATYRRPSLNNFSIKFGNFFQFSVFQRFSVEKDGFFCCFQLGKNGFRDLCVFLWVFLAL